MNDTLLATDEEGAGVVVEVAAAQETTQLGGTYTLWLGAASTDPIPLEANATDVHSAIEEALGVAVRHPPLPRRAQS